MDVELAYNELNDEEFLEWIKAQGVKISYRKDGNGRLIVSMPVDEATYAKLRFHKT